MGQEIRRTDIFRFIKKIGLIAIARLYKYRQQYTVAEIFYKKALDKNNRRLRSSYYYEYAYVLYQVKEFKRALVQINYAIDVSKKDNTDYIVLRAQIYIKLKQYGDAEYDLRHAIEISGDNEVAHYLLGDLLVLQKKWYQAKEALLVAQNLGYATAKFYHRLGRASFEMGHFADAVEAYQQAASMCSSKTKSPDRTSDLYYMAGLSSERMGSTEATQAFYDKALVFDKKYNSEKLGIGAFHHAYKQYDLAIKAYAEMEETEPLYRLATLYDKLGDKEKAIASYKRVLSLDQINSEYHFRLAVCYETTGNYKEAVVYYKQAIARRSNYNHQWYLKLLNALRKNGDTKEYEQVLDEANLVADYVNDVYRNGNNKMSRQMRYNIFYDKLHVVKKTVLVESASGNRVSGNPFAIFKYMLEDERFKDYTFIWTVNNFNVVPDKYKNFPNVIFVIRYTDLFYKYLSTASILINDTSFPYFFILKEGQKYLNTWHGTPWKTLGYDVKKAKMDYANTARNFLQATHLIVPNQYTYDHQIVPYQLASIYPGELAVTGYPRIDLTYKTMQNPRIMKGKLGIEDDKKIILYAPTWRGGVSFRSFDRQKLEDDLKRLSLIDDAHIIFRGHQLAESLLRYINIPNVTIVPSNFDTNEILGVVDILITDYSSVFFDFLVTGKPIVHYVYDYEEYTEERGLYFGLEKLPGEVVQSSDQMIATIQDLLPKSFQPTKKYLNAKEKYVYKDDGNVTKRVIDWFVFDKNNVEIMANGTTKNKILFYAGSFQPNGITSAFINLVKSVDKQLYDITITLSDSIINYPERIKQLDKIKDDVNILPKNGPMNFSDAGIFARDLNNFDITNDEVICNYRREYQKEYARLFGNINFDFIVDYSGYSSYYNQLLVSNPDQNTKNVVYAHNDMYNEYINRFPELWSVFEQYKQYDKIISVSKSISEVNKSNLSKKFQIPSSKFDYIENVQNPAAIIEKSVLPLNDLTEGKLFSKNVTVFITMGRLSGEKDQEKLIRAFAKVQQSNSKTRLLILGDGPLKYRLLSVIDELGVQNSVHLLGRKDNPYPYLKHSDCFVFPSNYEGQGLVLYEALALGKPIIATDIVTSRGVLEGGYGELCNNSISGLEQAMQSYLDGNLKFEKFEIEKYNQKALNLFYKRVL